MLRYGWSAGACCLWHVVHFSLLAVVVFFVSMQLKVRVSSGTDRVQVMQGRGAAEERVSRERVKKRRNLVSSTAQAKNYVFFSATHKAMDRIMGA